jgi:tellurium resistance protein TerD
MPTVGGVVVVSLKKGGNVNLINEAPGLTAVTVGLHWDARTTSGKDFDLDASALMCDQNGRVLSDKHFIFYHQLKSPEGSVVHQGDDLVGGGEGDNEQIIVDLATVPSQCQKIIFAVSIYDADEFGLTFGQVRNASIRVVNQTDGRELARYDLAEDAALETAMIFGEIYRRGDDWKFLAVGQGYETGLAGIAKDYGVNV